MIIFYLFVTKLLKSSVSLLQLYALNVSDESPVLINIATVVRYTVLKYKRLFLTTETYTSW